MIIKSIMTDEDRKALEYMLSLEYAMPYQLPVSYTHLTLPTILLV